MKFPELPDNQRWKLSKEFNQFLVLRLQEKRWWGWKTLLSSTGSVSGGTPELEILIDHIVRRDYFEAIMAEKRARDAKANHDIPYGIH